MDSALYLPGGLILIGLLLWEYVGIALRRLLDADRATISADAVAGR